MKERKQKIAKATCQRTDRAEPEGYVGGQTFMWITENNVTNVDRPQHGLLEEILSPDNLNKAYRRVKGNKGAGGVDKMETDDLLSYLSSHKEALLESILSGKYRPNPVRRVEIPKDNGKKRLLGIPTVVDRVIQQAITQVLSPIYERQFSETSYGFRPRRSAHQALRKCQEFIDEGYIYAIDMDLEKFFDTVNHSKLVEVLSRTIKDGRVISLIHKYLRAGVVVRNTFEETVLGGREYDEHPAFMALVQDSPRRRQGGVDFRQVHHCLQPPREYPVADSSGPCAAYFRFHKGSA